ncbi:MAG: MFS transporter [Sphingomonadaceae bacterium]|nr:MFS transporter [Sphingomonadaceae bacterium]
MRFYYGWAIVGITMAIQLLLIGSTLNAFGLFVVPVSEDFGLSRADVNTGLIISNLAGAAIAPFVGRMVDIYPVRLIMAISSVVFGCGLVLLGLSQSVWMSAVILAFAVPAGVVGVSQLGTLTLVARWFEAQRGRAMAFAIMGASLGSVIMAPTVGWLIETVGWRICLMFLGSTLGLVFLVLTYFMRERPGPDDIEPRPTSALPAPAVQKNGKLLSTKQILQIPLFWYLVLGTALTMGAFQTIVISLVPIAQEDGVSITKSATLLSMLGAMAMVGKLVLVWVGDRFDKALALSAMFAGLSVVVASLVFAEGYTALLICSALLGLGVGATMPIFLALLADYVGTQSFGSANGLTMLFMAGSGAVGMRFGGEVYDRTGGYEPMFVTFTVICLISALLILMCWVISRKQSNAGVDEASAAQGR